MSMSMCMFCAADMPIHEAGFEAGLDAKTLSLCKPCVIVSTLVAKKLCTILTIINKTDIYERYTIASIFTSFPLLAVPAAGVHIIGGC